MPTPVAMRATAVAQPVVPPASLGELRRLEAAWAEEEYRRRPVDTSRSAVPGTFVRPAAGAVTGLFGEPRRSGAHPGLDLDGETGDAVSAAAPGTVVHAGPPPAGYSGYGTLVVIDHGNDVQTLYAHLSAVAVAAGTRVHAGDIVGAIGTTGVVTGSHLHFEVRVAGVTVDPTSWLAP